MFYFTAFILFYCNPVFSNQNTELKNFLVIADLHTNSSAASLSMQISPSGASTYNDLDSTTFWNILQAMATKIGDGTVQKPAFVIFVGDIVRHNLLFDSDFRIADETDVFTQLNTMFSGLGVPIFYVFGNHDSTFGYDWSFYVDDPRIQYKSPYLVAQASGWTDGFLSTGAQCRLDSRFSKPCLINENTQYGYYSAYIQEKLRLVVLNTSMLWTSAIGTTTEGVNAQFNWFVAEMQSAKDNGESVLLAMHVPFGNYLQNPSPEPINYMVSSYNDSFLAIVGKYNDIIIGMVGGHEHFEELKILTQSGKPVNFLIDVTSLATHSGNAPAFTTVYFKDILNYRWVLTDYETFNFTGTSENPVLNHLYSFNHVYCDDQATSILNCFQRISVSKLVDTMNYYHTAGNPNFSLNLLYPDNIFTALPASASGSSGGGSSFGTAAIIAGTASAIGAGVLIVEEKTSGK